MLDASLLNRIPGAIKAGNDVISFPTYFGNEMTDIREDFLVASGTGTTVTIPTGANYLFLSADDSIFSDNANPHNDFGVQISYVSSPVPETSTTLSLGLLLVLGLGGLAVSERRRRASSLL